VDITRICMAWHGMEERSLSQNVDHQGDSPSQYYAFHCLIYSEHGLINACMIDFCRKQLWSFDDNVSMLLVGLCWVHCAALVCSGWGKVVTNLSYRLCVVKWLYNMMMGEFPLELTFLKHAAEVRNTSR
jgi:hypothetical protein